MEIRNSVAVVTGGASGLGGATVRRLVAQGGKVAVFDLAEDAGNKLAAELGEGVIFVKTNVVEEESVQNAVNEAVERFGGIQLVVNCAGIGVAGKVLGKKGPMSLEDFNKVIQINLVGTFNVIRLAAEKMIQNTPNQRGGKRSYY